jgi:hypothetical protein
MASKISELDRAIRMLNDRLQRIEMAEALLKEIATTGNHYQIKEKINKYFQIFNKEP